MLPIDAKSSRTTIIMKATDIKKSLLDSIKITSKKPKAAVYPTKENNTTHQGDADHDDDDESREDHSVERKESIDARYDDDFECELREGSASAFAAVEEVVCEDNNNIDVVTPNLDDDKNRTTKKRVVTFAEEIRIKLYHKEEEEEEVEDDYESDDDRIFNVIFFGLCKMSIMY